MQAQLFQVAVKALIRNDEGQILMVHVPDWGKNKAHWDLPGGRMDPGENFEDTLLRELQEEIGILTYKSASPFGAALTNITIPVDDVEYPLVYVVFDVRLELGATIKLDPDSSEDAYQWFPAAQAADEMTYKMRPDFRELVRKL